MEIMEIVKKNVLSIICGVIALVALVALQWPVNGMYADTQAQLAERKKAYDQLHLVRTGVRSWPAMPGAEQAGPPIHLNHFPNEAVLAKGKEIEDAIHQQADEMKRDTAVNNEHQPLAPGILPSPGENRYQFEAPYRKKVAPQVIIDFLNAGVPPTDQEVHTEADRIYNSDFGPKIITVAGKPVNKDQIDDAWKEAASKLQNKMRIDRARGCKIYLNPMIIPNDLAIFNNPQGPRETEIWYSQMQQWVESDVLSAIKRINDSSTDVTQSPIKELSSLGVAADKSMYVVSGGGPATFGAPPDPNGNFAKGITGRVCNSLYDVISFSMVINVDARKIPYILAELQKGQLITITHVNGVAVDGNAAAENGFFYGDVPVIRLTLEGEDVYLRDWTTKLMPDAVKTELGIPIPPKQ